MNALTTAHDLGVDPIRVIKHSSLSATTKRQYCRAIELYLETGGNLADAEQLADYARDLKSSPKAFLKAAVKLWTTAVERRVKATSTPENVNAVLATIHRLESLNQAIQVQRTKGSKPHNWLSGSQVKHLREVVDNNRDYLIISLMLQAGLRRNEVVTLRYLDVQLLGDMHILIVIGKGEKSRTIPITPTLAEGLKTWPNGSGLEIFPLAGQTIMDICRKYGRQIDLPNLSPHDLRRTFAQIALDNGVSIVQISQLLGHSSVATTQRYLDLDTQKLPTVGDFMQF